MPTAELDNADWRGYAANVGGKLKTKTLWNGPNLGATNSRGFTALAGRYRRATGEYANEDY